MKLFSFVFGIALCLLSCSGNQDVAQDDEQAARENVVSEDLEKEAEHATLSGFTIEDSSWKIVWHGSSDADLLVGIVFSFLISYRLYHFVLHVTH